MLVVGCFLRAIPAKIRYFTRMSTKRHIQNIALIGFMGTGKSSVGQLVAQQLHFTFLDTDHVIEARTNKSISDIFAHDGEPTFRDLEKKIVAELALRKKTVISTGGGLPVNPDNLASLKSHSLVVCLWASAEKIWDRVHNQSHRPLLNEPDPLAKIKKLLEQREPFYRQADVLLNTEMRALKDVAQQVIHQYHLAHAAHR
jgi:shikimate kinase